MCQCVHVLMFRCATFHASTYICAFTHTYGQVVAWVDADGNGQLERKEVGKAYKTFKEYFTKGMHMHRVHKHSTVHMITVHVHRVHVSSTSTPHQGCGLRLL